jgi:tetratricopeptide (TPR) repeat protein
MNSRQLFLLLFLILKLPLIGFTQQQREIEQEAKDFEQYKSNGLELFNSKNYIEAIKQFNRAADIYERYYSSKEYFTKIAFAAHIVDVYRYRGYAKKDLGDYYGAEKDFLKCLDVINDTGINIQKCEIYYDLSLTICLIKNKSEIALSYLNQAIKLCPGNCEYLIAHAASIYEFLGKKEEGCKEWSEAAEKGCDEAYNYIQKYCKK